MVLLGKVHGVERYKRYFLNTEIVPIVASLEESFSDRFILEVTWQSKLGEHNVKKVLVVDFGYICLARRLIMYYNIIITYRR